MNFSFIFLHEVTMASGTEERVLDKKPNNSNKETSYNYAERLPRVTKEELFMILAFWMGESPLSKPLAKEKLNVGAVLVKPDNKIFALDCSRNGIHGVTRLLTKFPRDAQGSAIYSSRKPCSLCTKLLVQCKVAKLFYLPISPEKNDEKDITKVDHLFKVSEVAQRVFIPNCKFKDSILNKSIYSPMKEPEKEELVEQQVKRWRGDYWDDSWLITLKTGLPWLAFDEKMEKQVSSDMKSMFEWISNAAITDPAHSVEFKKFKDEVKQGQSEEDWQKLALHSTRLAKILSYKTDDPKRGVGAVIMMDNENIVAIGWNGFPSKALYGDFPRASESDGVPDHDKYPYVIHAEQNALLTRNKDDIRSESTTLFVTKTPCNECVPLLYEAGIKKVVLPAAEKDTSSKSEKDTSSKSENDTSSKSEKDTSSKDSKSKLNYDLLYNDTFGFEIIQAYYTFTTGKKSIPASEKVSRKLDCS